MTDPKNPTPGDVKGVSKAVLAAFAAGVIAGGGSVQLAHLGGATLDSPPTARSAGASLYVQAARIEQPRPGSLTIETYSTTKYGLPDAGVKLRDNGPRRCAGGAATAKAVTSIEAACAPKASGSWLHVVELRPVGDGGTVIEAYAMSPLADGGSADQGRQSCTPNLDADVADLIFGEALACASPVLDEP